MTQDEIETGLIRAVVCNLRYAPSGVYLIDWMPLLIVAVVFWAALV